MCEYCRKIPHDPRCPLAPPPIGYAHCEECAEAITEGEEYIEVDDRYFHYDCVCGMSTGEILDLFEYGVKTMEERYD